MVAKSGEDPVGLKDFKFEILLSLLALVVCLIYWEELLEVLFAVAVFFLFSVVCLSPFVGVAGLGLLVLRLFATRQVSREKSS